jgi:hypothetical protein
LPVSWLYALYAFVIAFINTGAGLRLVKREGWDKLLGYSSLAVAAVAVVAGLQSVMGFAVDPLLLLLPLVVAGSVITIESWRTVHQRGIGGWLLAIYNTFAWVANLAQLLFLLQDRRR